MSVLCGYYCFYYINERSRRKTLNILKVFFVYSHFMFQNSNTFEKMRTIPNELTSLGRCSFVQGRRRLYPPFEVLHLQVMPFFQRQSFVQPSLQKIGALASLVIKSLIPSSFNNSSAINIGQLYFRK